MMIHPKMSPQERKNKRRQLVKKYGDRCTRCGWREGSPTLDHIVPITRGGNNSLYNLQLLCQFCNELKGNSIADYRRAA